MINVASIQMRVEDAEKEANISKASRLIDEAEGADLILLPEIWNIGYFAFSSYREQSESLDGPTVSALRGKAAEKGCFVFLISSNLTGTNKGRALVGHSMIFPGFRDRVLVV